MRIYINFYKQMLAYLVLIFVFGHFLPRHSVSAFQRTLRPILVERHSLSNTTESLLSGRWTRSLCDVSAGLVVDSRRSPLQVQRSLLRRCQMDALPPGELLAWKPLPVSGAGGAKLIPPAGNAAPGGRPHSAAGRSAPKLALCRWRQRGRSCFFSEF